MKTKAATTDRKQTPSLDLVNQQQISELLTSVADQGRVSPCAEMWIAAWIQTRGLGAFESLVRNGMESAHDRNQTLKSLLNEYVSSAAGD